MAQQVKGLRAPPLSSGGRRPPPRGGAPTPAAHRGALAELQRACALRLRLAHTPLAAPEGGGFSPPGPRAAAVAKSKAGAHRPPPPFLAPPPTARRSTGGDTALRRDSSKCVANGFTSHPRGLVAETTGSVPRRVAATSARPPRRAGARRCAGGSTCA